MEAFIDGSLMPHRSLFPAIGIVLDRPSCRTHIHQPLKIRCTDSNRVEYAALLFLLQFALRTGCKKLIARSDSDVVVRQIHGGYTCHSHLADIHQACLLLIGMFERSGGDFTIIHISRRNNREADALARKIPLPTY